MLDNSFVEEAKGVPYYGTYERRGLVEAMGYADEVYVEFGNVRQLTHSNRAIVESPCIVAVGSDWYARDYHERLGIGPEALKGLGITLAFIPYTEGISTTDINERILNGRTE